ncbi:MAG TPA: hypothetical protein VFH73_19385 [Polyangia bacterium]|jgi:hypothetical protein|nr:hypothetical protein [Polyangia bacterium]
MGKDLLVPGTGGNKLLLDNDDLGWPSALAAQGWLAGATGFAVGLNGVPIPAQKIVEVLSMEFSDATSTRPTKTTLQAGSAVGPGQVLDLVYNQFGDYERFVYDFRADIRHSGERLLAHLIDNQPTGERWRIACHSQGGLVVAVASKLCAQQNTDDDRAFAKLVSHVAFVAVPFYGTVSAAAGLLSGEDLSAGFASSFKTIAHTWPSLHQMLPVWPGSVRLKNGAAVSNAAFNTMDPAAWPGANIDPAMLSRARDTRTQFLNSPLSRMNGVKKRILMSRAWSTSNHLVIENGVASIAPPEEPGDTLVPATTTYGMEAKVEKEVTHQFGSGGDTMKHFALSVDPFVASEVASFFNQ